MNKDKLIEALETALAELKRPTISFTPPKREPLSDDEIILLGVQNLCNEANSFKAFCFARAIEKAHGIGE